MLLSPSLIQYHTEKTESARAAGLDKPICTVDASNRYGLTSVNLVEYYGGGRPLDVQSPMHTVTSHDREAVVAAHVVKYKRDEVGTRPSEPLPTQTAGGVFGCCKAVLYKIGTSERLHYWPQIRDLLNRYCGYALGADDLLLCQSVGRCTISRTSVCGCCRLGSCTTPWAFHRITSSTMMRPESHTRRRSK